MLTSTQDVGVTGDYIDIKRALLKEWRDAGGTFNEADNYALCPPCAQQREEEPR